MLYLPVFELCQSLADQLIDYVDAEAIVISISSDRIVSP
jgi:hypothetical protein